MHGLSPKSFQGQKGDDMFSISKTIIASTFALLALGGATTSVNAQSSAGLPVASLPAAAAGDARAPYAWVDFCKKYAGECQVNLREPESIKLTPQIWKTLVTMSARVNKEVEAITDEDHWGVIDRWDLAEDGKGDCEEYVLVKRKRLAEEAGIPRRAMLVTVVLDENNAGHAVLMVRTDRGDFALDNKRDAVLPWSQTGYVYVKRESQYRTGWTSLGGAQTPTVASVQR